MTVVRLLAPHSLSAPALLRLWALLLLSIIAGLCPQHRALAAEPEWIYVVRPGDTLIGICDRFLAHPEEWEKVRRLNNVAEPRVLQPGRKIAIPVSWLAQQPAPANVIAVRGQVSVRALAANAGTQAVVGAKVGPGAEISVSEGAQLVVEFADGSTLQVMERTLLQFDTLSVFGATGMVDTRVRLQRGRVETKVAPVRGPASRYQIMTPTAVGAVRGTTFRMNVAQSADVTRSEVFDGNVAVEGSGATVSVPAGFGTVVEQGKPPQPPRTLLVAPDLSALPKSVSTVAATFTWPPVADAAGYRVRLVPDSASGDPLREAVVDRAEVAYDDLRDGRYRLIVRAIDRDGLEGADATADFTVSARLAAPQLLAPPDGTKFRSEQPEFRWSAVSSAHSYRVLIARDAQMQDIVATQDLGAATAFKSERPFEAGTYFWQVIGLDSSAARGTFSAPWQFSVKQLPGMPPPPNALTGQSGTQVDWPAGQSGDRYRFQVATEETFAAPLSDVTLDQNQWVPSGLPYGKYFVRFQIIDNDGDASPFSPPTSFEIPLPPLLRAPTPLTPATAEVTRACAMRFSWNGVEDAVAYRLHLTPDVTGAAQPARAQATALALAKPLPPGTYSWTVSAIDRFDREGAASAPASFECRAEPPPVRSLPPDLKHTDALLRWDAQATAGQRYQVQVARDPLFNDVVLDSETAGTQSSWAKPAPGKYYQRVRIVDSDGYQGVFGASEAFEVKSTAWLYFFLFGVFLFVL